MIEQISQLREKYGSSYVTSFPDGLVVPWTTISIKEYIKYKFDLQRGLVAVSQIEEEIFKKYVLDDSIVRQMNYLKAGVVSTVSTHIIQHSGPIDHDSLNQDLHDARNLLNNSNTGIIHQLVQVILNAFPSYTPEHIYEMEYSTFLFRFAQAENKLLHAGVLKEPIDIVLNEPDVKPKKPKFKNLNVDAKELWEKRHSVKQNPNKETPSDKEKWWQKSPVLESDKRHNINFSEESFNADLYELDNVDRNLPLETQKLLAEKLNQDKKQKLAEDARIIYKDLIEELKNKR